jgi:hypothetical protein
MKKIIFLSSKPCDNTHRLSASGATLPSFHEPLLFNQILNTGNIKMQELNMTEVNEVPGGELATGVAFGGGLATSIVIGASLGPAGVAVAVVGFSAAFGGTWLVQRFVRRF